NGLNRYSNQSLPTNLSHDNPTLHLAPQTLPHGTFTPRSHAHIAILKIPGEPSEPTSTLVLTSPRGYYVDIRINKSPQPSSDPRTFDGKLQWAFAGTKTSIEKDARTISTWHHPIDSLSDDPKPDVGEMTELENGDVLEIGQTINEDTGEVIKYEELWEELLPQFWSQDSWRKCVVLKTLNEDKACMGMAIRCGSFAQGILKRK
ncbi:MAG: hypothetical protein Q9180_005874, partial [Flavoplaca navasiana]